MGGGETRGFKKKKFSKLKRGGKDWQIFGGFGKAFFFFFQKSPLFSREQGDFWGRGLGFLVKKNWGAQFEI